MPTAMLRADEPVAVPQLLHDTPARSSEDSASGEDRALFQHFLAVRRRARGPIVCVNRRMALTNAAAESVVRRDDVDELWTWACRALVEHDGSVHALCLRDVQLSARCEAIRDGSQVIGALIRVGTSANSSTRAHRPRGKKPSRVSIGWESLRESELGIAQLVATGLTNREVGARLFMSHHTVDFYMRQIFRKLDISSRVELTRLVVERGRQP